MSAVTMTCAMCGHLFDPRGTSLCESCPLGNGCALACCPNCGYSAPAPGASALLRLGARVASALGGSRRAGKAEGETLATASAGARVEIASLADVPHGEREQLLAYGIAPGRVVEVLQRTPVTIVRLEHLELALERGVGRGIHVKAATTDGGAA